MSLKEKYTKQEVETYSKKVYFPGDKLPKNRCLVPYYICKELGLLGEFKKPSGFVFIEYLVQEGFDFKSVNYYEPLFNLGKYKKYIKETDEGGDGFATENEIMAISDSAGSDGWIDPEKCQAIGYTYNKPYFFDDEDEQAEGFVDWDYYELVYDIRREPIFKEYLQKTVLDYQEWLDDPSFFDQADKELKEILRGNP